VSVPPRENWANLYTRTSYVPLVGTNSARRPGTGIRASDMMQLMRIVPTPGDHAARHQEELISTQTRAQPEPVQFPVRPYLSVRPAIRSRCQETADIDRGLS